MLKYSCGTCGCFFRYSSQLSRSQNRFNNSFRQKLKKYTTPDLLIIDEFGLKKLSQTNVDDLYEVIPKRYEKSSTIITSNKQFDEWGGILYDPVLATAILDRFVHHCSFIVIEGESYRMKERERITRVFCKCLLDKAPAGITSSLPEKRPFETPHICALSLQGTRRI